MKLEFKYTAFYYEAFRIEKRFGMKIIRFLLICMVFCNVAWAQDPEPEVWDPIEPVNRGMFWFNEQVDYLLLEPVAKGYDWLLPDIMKEGVTNFFNNLRYPSYLLSDIVQFKFGQVAHHTGRFVVNTILGVGGLVDVAKHMGLEDHKEDFGIALAYHGVPSGPYLVLPIVGPSNLRDGFGLLVDTLISPTSIVSYTNASSDTKLAVTVGGKTLEAVNTRARLVDVIDSARRNSLDYYLFLQGAYVQYRAGVLNDGNMSDSGLYTSSETSVNGEEEDELSFDEE